MDKVTQATYERVAKLCEERAEGYGAVRQSALTAITLDRAAQLLRLAALAETRSDWRVPDGWTLVPIEPTEAMQVEGCVVSLCPWSEVGAIWTAMLAAAPNPLAAEASDNKENTRG